MGENSTGKSTVLGCLQTLSNFARGVDLDFNVEPYQMGAFADIVRSHPQKKEFKLGIKFKNNREQDLEYLLTLIETAEGSEPVVQEQSLLSANGDQWIIKRQNTQDSPTQRDNASDSGFEITAVKKRSLGNGEELLVATVGETIIAKKYAFGRFQKHVGQYFPDKKALVERPLHKSE